MPGDGAIPFIGESYWAYDLSIAVLNGSVPVDRLNDMVTRIVATWYQLGQDANYPPPNFSSNTRARTGPLYPAALFSPTGVVNEYVNVQADHYKIVREIGRDAITMLKNDNRTLPLSTGAKIRIYGSDAGSNPKGPNDCENRACDIGVLGYGKKTPLLHSSPFLALL
ncbi:hypothetical protein GP486_008769 [Trichoglossum hirsutum]|uniref:beta-glucosidase n=1 Tax=Trichoglossum hirsutum TaxID=265104 RepID=A0A9P8I6L8_9PEZI|nr:hypothetical protein GP486_008769 [Trichoglossum hirsutum]